MITPSKTYVVDTSVLVSFMLNPNGLCSKIIKSLALTLYTPHQAIDEIWRHKFEWFRKRPFLSLTDFVKNLGYYVIVVNVNRYSNEYLVAFQAMKNIDPNDAEFVSLALELKAPVWSEDEDFTRQNLVQVVTSRRILDMSPMIPELFEVLKDEYLNRTTKFR